MIRVEKGVSPQILVDNQAAWTEALQELINRYGSYKAIPQKERDAAVNKYKHDDILEALERDRGGKKCVYCESLNEVTSFAHIDHYHPKSLYPNETFCWDNLFMGCQICNTHKDNFDTSLEPFVHPLNDDPEEYLTFDELRIVPRSMDFNSEDYKKAYNVIDKCYLWRTALSRKYSLILIHFYEYESSLRKSVAHYKTLVQDVARKRIAIEILDSLSTLSQMASPDAEYAGYMRYLLRKFEVIREAVSIINSYPNDLVPDTAFEWGFRF